MSDKSHLWYAVKLPLLFLHPDDTFTLKRLPTPSIRITQPPWLTTSHRSRRPNIVCLRVSRKLLSLLWTRRWRRALLLSPCLQSTMPSPSLCCRCYWLPPPQSPCLNLISDEAKSFIRRLAALDLLHCPTQGFYVTLAYPHPHHHHHYRHTTPRRPLPRRHNWSPRAKWHSALTDIRATNKFSYFTATAAASHSSTQSSGGWNNQYPSPRVVTQTLEEEEEEKDDLGRGDTMSGFFWTCSPRIVASLHGLNREKSRWFSDASCKVENHITLLKIQWTKNLRAATRGWLGYTDINKYIICCVKLIHHCSRELRCPANHTSLVMIQFESLSFSFSHSLLTV